MLNRAVWRDERFLKILAQAGFVILLALAAGFLYANVTANLRRQGIAVGYGFLDNPASFDIGESPIPYNPADTYARALLVGLLNTLIVSAWGIVFATIVGVIMGVARLSTNWLVRQLAAAYVGVIRNTPLVIQLMFWYFGVILQLPPVRQAIALPGAVFLSQRGLYLPWPHLTENAGAWLPFLAAGLFLGAGLGLWLRQIRRRAERPLPWAARLAPVGLFLALAALGAAALPGSPLAVDRPALAGLNFRGGLRLSPEMAALLFGLVVYTGAFIAEIVRAGLQAVSRGQWEAALSLGLSRGLALRLVIFPQALRIIIPPITSQYLNLAKNSSLAIAIGFPDLFSVAGTVFNQTGAAVEIILILMVSYLVMSLVTSTLMNAYNARVRLVER